MKKTNWHSQSIENCLQQLNTNLQGLSSQEAKNRLQKYGKNEIQFSKKRRIWRKLLQQFNNILIYILLIAAIITLVLQHWIDSSVIFGVVVLNALIGYLQEGKAEKPLVP